MAPTTTCIRQEKQELFLIFSVSLNQKNPSFSWGHTKATPGLGGLQMFPPSRPISPPAICNQVLFMLQQAGEQN